MEKTINKFFTETEPLISRKVLDKIWEKVRTSARFGAGGGKMKTKRDKQRISEGLKPYTSREYQDKYGHELTIDKKYLQKLFSIQNRLCAVSGWEMNEEYNLIPNHSLQISVDRIDSTKGYIEENCQLVLTCFNRMKNDCNEDDWNDIKTKLGF